MRSRRREFTPPLHECHEAGLSFRIARSERHQHADAPPKIVMNSRRFMSVPYLDSLLSNCCATRMMSSLR